MACDLQSKLGNLDAVRQTREQVWEEIETSLRGGSVYSIRTSDGLFEGFEKFWNLAFAVAYRI